MATFVKNKFSVRGRFKKIHFNNHHALVSSAKKGVSPHLFYEFAETIKMSEKQLAAILNLSARTISNYKEQKKLLSPVQSEHLLKLVKLFNKGEDVFGTTDEFNTWLKKPLWNVNETPFNLLATQGGVDLLMSELDKLSQGYPL